MYTSYEAQPLGKWILDDAIIIDKQVSTSNDNDLQKWYIFQLLVKVLSTHVKCNESKT